jgi:hypothetical protein
VQTESRAAMIIGKEAMIGTDLATSNLCRNNKMETMHCDAWQNDSADNITINTTALLTIIDFPSYFHIIILKPIASNMFLHCWKKRVIRILSLRNVACLRLMHNEWLH